MIVVLLLVANQATTRMVMDKSVNSWPQKRMRKFASPNALLSGNKVNA